MAVAFPTSLLTKITRMTRVLNEHKAIFESLLTRQRQVVSLGAGTADRWEGVIETVSLSPSEVRTMEAFLHQTGKYGEFTVKNPDYAGAQSGEASGLVVGGGQSGTSLIVDSVLSSQIIVRAGEFFSVGSEFKVVTQDCTSSGTTVTLVFKPALRASPADNAPVTFDTPLMTAILLDDAAIDTDNLGRAIFRLAYQEAM